ncbi:MAG: COX15/CtaA family protein [Burkholderiales bacterium]|nr:COX15/CtaA family protein [Burkholderiales bacterium]
MHATSAPRRLLARAALLGCVLMAVIVISSAFLRLTSIGIGCADWPQCYGRLASASAAADPLPPAAVRVARLLHRFAAMLTGVLVLFMLIVSITRAGRTRANFGAALALCLATILLAAIGRSSAGTLVPLIGVVNLVGGFTMLLLFWLLWSTNASASGSTPAPVQVRLAAFALLAALLAQVAAGALSSVTYGVTTCSAPLTCATDSQGSLEALRSLTPSVPLQVEDERVIAPKGAAELQLLHRYSGLALGAILIALGAWLLWVKRLRALAVALVAAAAAELLLGLAMVSGPLPLSAALAHNALAAVLLLLLAFLALRRSRGD